MALYPAFHPVNRAKIVRKGLETKQSSRISRILGNAGTLGVLAFSIYKKFPEVSVEVSIGGKTCSI